MVPRRGVLRTGLVCVLMLLAASMAWAAPKLPENLAANATVGASSEYSNQYLAKFAVDGKVPHAGSKADIGKVWAVKGDTHRGGAELTIEWPEPVTVAEIVYYGRTAWEWVENWKDYTVHLDGAAEPVVKGRLKPGHGPQRIKMATPTRARRVTLKFLSSYGGSNPGASEIAVYATSPPEKALGVFLAKAPSSKPKQLLPKVTVKDSPELAADLKAGRLGFTHLLLLQSHPINCTHVYTYHNEGFRPGGGLYVYDVTTGDLRPLVDAAQGQILDADLSWDASTVLFSWRKAAAEPYHLFTIGLDGANPTQLTRGPHHNFNCCWVPDGSIVFLSTRMAQFAYCWTSPVGVLYRMPDPAVPEQVTRISANYLNDFTPAVMNDGRIIYSRWEYVDRPAIPIQSLWTIRPDGTGLSVFYGNRVLSPATFMEARSIPGSTSVLCTLTAHNGPTRGGVGIIDPTRGVNAQAAIRNLTPEVDIGRVDRGSGNHVRGPYKDPYPIDGRYYLVSRFGTILVRDYEGTRQAVVVEPRDGIGFFSARPVRARLRPPAVPSILPEGEREGQWATLYLQDVYNGLGPHVERGEVKRVRVVQELPKPVRIPTSQRTFGFQFPTISCGATYAAKKVWGTAKVEADGSAYFKVPAGVPIYFMALDAEGRAVQRMRSFTHLMAGETQGCIGCHESRHERPRLPRPEILKREPQDLTPPEWGMAGFDYARVVQPVLDRHCVKCHGGATPPKGVDLCSDATDFFNVSYETLARDGANTRWGGNAYTNWISTYNGSEANILTITPKAWGSCASKVAAVILSGHPDADGKPRACVPPADRRRVFAWIDLNVPYYGTLETAYPKAKGCRRIYPAGLDQTLSEVASRRCAACHKGGKVPRRAWTRLENPHLNSFLLAPLAKGAGGTERCGKAVFTSANDLDYRAILRAFDPVLETIKTRPRMDMPGATASAEVNRSAI